LTDQKAITENKSVNSWRPAAFGDFWKKTSKCMWLSAGISPVWYAQQTR